MTPHSAFVALVLSVIALSAAPQAAAAESDAQAEHARIGRERAAVDARLKSDTEDCYQKFAVTDCRREASRRHREALADLKRQEASLNAAERKKAGADQLRRIEEKSSATRQQEGANRRAQAQADTAKREERSAQKAAQRASQAGAGAAPRVSEESRASQAAARQHAATEAPAQAAKFRDKQKDAADHKAALEKRLAERTKPAARPLPDPAVPQASAPAKP